MSEGNRVTGNRVTRSPALPDEVIEEAVRAAADATQEPWWEMQGRDEAEVAFRAAAPIIAKAERDRIKARIEEIDWDRGLPELVVSQEQEGAFRLFRRAALSAIEGEHNE